MIARAYGLSITALFGASMLLWLSSCTQLAMRRPDDADIAAASPGRWTGPARHHIAQLLIEGRPTYAVCEEPACPVVTRKILASASAEGQAEARAADQVSELDHDPERDPEHAPASDQQASNSSAAMAMPARASSPEGLASSPWAMPGAAPIASSLAPPSVASTERQTAITFAPDSAVLTQQAKQALDRAMHWARQADRIVISGRTDSLGSEPLNQRLAFARALAVREYIRDQIPEVNNVIAIDARGSCCFVASNATAQGRLRNRRVEVVFRGQRAREES